MTAHASTERPATVTFAGGLLCGGPDPIHLPMSTALLTATEEALEITGSARIEPVRLQRSQVRGIKRQFAILHLCPSLVIVHDAPDQPRSIRFLSYRARRVEQALRGLGYGQRQSEPQRPVG